MTLKGTINVSRDRVGQSELVFCKRKIRKDGGRW